MKERGISNFIFWADAGMPPARYDRGLDAGDTSASINWRAITECLILVMLVILVLVRSGAITIHCPSFKFYESIPSQAESFKTQRIEVKRRGRI